MEIAVKDVNKDVNVNSEQQAQGSFINEIHKDQELLLSESRQILENKAESPRYEQKENKEEEYNASLHDDEEFE